MPHEGDVEFPGDLVLAQASGSQVAEPIPALRSRSAPSRWAAKTRSQDRQRWNRLGKSRWVSMAQ
jgi:hypothetical protein